MATFTVEDVKAEARRQYGKPISIDYMEDAMQEPTLQDAVNVILLDSACWDSPVGNPFGDELP